LLPGLIARMWWAGSITVMAVVGSLAAIPAAGAQTVGAETTGATVADLQRQSAQLQLQLLEAVTRYESSRAKSAEINARAEELQRQAKRARDEAASLRDELGRFAAGLYRSGGVGDIPMAVLSLPQEIDPGAAMHVISGLEGVSEAKSLRVTQAIAAQERARQLADTVVRAASIRRAAAARAAAAYEAIEAKTAAVQAELASQLATLDASYRARAIEQDARNRAAWGRWRQYLADLAAAQVVPPPARALNDSSALPAPLRPLRDSAGRAVRGVAQVEHDGTPLVVLPAETIRAVSAAFGQLSVPYAADAMGPQEFGCGGLTRHAWRQAGYRIPGDPAGQWAGLRPVERSQLQVGDLVFFGDETVGIHHVAFYLGADMVLSSDPVAGEVGAQPLPVDGLFGSARVTLPRPGRPAPLPTPADGVPPMKCGTAQVAAAGSVWTMPLALGTYTLSAEFGISGDRWSSGQHTGQDFAAPVGTPVYAASAGVVRVEKPSWAGNLVRIEHGGNLESWYAHMSRVFVAPGQRVAAGTLIGAVGNEGNSTGPHLHFEARLAGRAVDPMPFLTGAQAGWGAFPNGMIPESKLCPLGVGSHVLRCDAARAWTTLAQAYAKRFGTALCLTDSYRSYRAQVELFAKKPALAALPGTSNHGWGLAVDLCGGVNDFGTPQHRWVAANGPRFGWYHPRWAARGGSRPEPWHFEFGRSL